MTHPRDEFPKEQQMEAKLKSLLMNFLYRQYLLKRSDEQVIKAVAQKNLPRIDRQTWWQIKQQFREREMSTPAAMTSIRRKIGMSA